MRALDLAIFCEGQLGSSFHAANGLEISLRWALVAHLLILELEAEAVKSLGVSGHLVLQEDSQGNTE